MLRFESRSVQFFFFSLKFSKFMPVLFIGTGAGAVDTAFFFFFRICGLCMGLVGTAQIACLAKGHSNEVNQASQFTYPALRSRRHDQVS